MPNDPQQNNNLTPFQRLPDDIKDAMSSIENAEINGKIAEKYQLEEEKISLLVNVIARVILKEISLMDFPRSLKDALNIDVETTKAMALDIAIRRFLPLKNHLGDVESLIRKLGGEVPKGSPLAQPAIKTPSSALPLPLSFLHKNLRAALKDTKETEDQLITSQPIRIEGFNGLVRPSLKNWLSDYIRLEGVGPHSLLVLTSYLYNSVNGKILNPRERKTLGKILQSYDENSSLPVLEKTGLVALEELERETSAIPPLPPSPLPAKTPAIAPAASERSTPQIPEQPSAPIDRLFRQNTEEKPPRQQPPIPPVFSTNPPQKQDPPTPERIYQKPPFSPAPTPLPDPFQKQSADWQTKETRHPSPSGQGGYLEPINDLESINPASRAPLPRTESRPGQRGAQPHQDNNIIDLKNFRQS